MDASSVGPPSGDTLRILYARGDEPRRLAEALSDDPARVSGDIREHCIAFRADAVVTRRLATSLDLVPQLVPHALDLDETERIVAAVSSGPHSEFAARVAALLGDRLQVAVELVCAYSTEDGPDQAIESVAILEHSVPGISHRIVEAERAWELIEEADGALLVLGAPGGSYLQRRFFGPGARLVAHARVGAITVRSAPRRVFHEMVEPDWVGIHLPASEALRLTTNRVVPVVDEGVVVGMVTHDVLVGAGSAPVGEVMGPVVTVEASAPLVEARVAAALHGGTAAIVDAEERLVGLWSPRWEPDEEE